MNVDWIVTNKSQKFTHEIQNHWRLLVSIGLTLQGIFLNFQEHLCAFTAHLFLRNYSLQFYNNRLLFLRGKLPAINILLSEHKSGQTRQAANSLLLACEHSPHVNNKPISIPYLEQGYRCNITIFNWKVEF